MNSDLELHSILKNLAELAHVLEGGLEIGDEYDRPAAQFPTLAAQSSTADAAVAGAEAAPPPAPFCWHSETVPAEISATIFRFLVESPQNLTNLEPLRCVCTTWKQLIDSSWHNVQNISFSTRSGHVFFGSRVKRKLFTTEKEGSNYIDLPSFELLRKHRVILSDFPSSLAVKHEEADYLPLTSPALNRYSIVDKHKYADADNNDDKENACLFEFYTRQRTETDLFKTVLEIAEQHPDWFRSLRLDRAPEQKYGREFVDARVLYTLSWTINRAQIAQILDTAEPYSEVDITIPILFAQVPVNSTNWMDLYAIPSQAQFAMQREFMDAWLRKTQLPMETLDSTSLDTRVPANAFHDYQLQGVAWLRHTEAKILKGEPLDSNRFFCQPNTLSGSALSMDLLLPVGEAPSPPSRLYNAPGRVVTSKRRRELELDPKRPSVSVYSRGVIYGDATGLGKTRTVAGFLLGSTQDLSHVPVLVEIGDPAAATALAMPRNVLLRTHAIEFGAQTQAAVNLLPLGLFYTRASLVIVPNTTVTTWQAELKATFPHRNVIFLGDKRDHEAVTYLELASADLVIVTRSFLGKNAYYASATRRFATNLSGFEVFTDDLIHSNQPFEQRTAPWLRAFAWERVVVEECHEVIPLNDLRTDYFNELGIALFSARMVIAISATLHDLLAVDAFYTCFLDSWFNIGFTVTHFDALFAEMSVIPKGTQQPQQLHQHKDMQLMYSSAVKSSRMPFSPLLGLLQQRSNNQKITSRFGFCLWNEASRPYLYKALLNMTMRSTIWKNTLANVGSTFSTPDHQMHTIDVSVHPIQLFLSKLQVDPARDMTNLEDINTLQVDPKRDILGLNGVLDLPLVRPYQHRPSAAASKRRNGLQATKLQPNVANVLVGAANRVRSILALGDAANATHEGLVTKCLLTPMEERTAQWTARIKKLRANISAMTDRLQPVRALPDQLEALHPLLIAKYPTVVDDVEAQYGSKVSAMCRAIDAIFEQQPDAQIIIASVYATAMQQVLDDVLVRRRHRPYAALGGKNLATSKKQEQLFQEGRVQVLFLNLNQAASGLNLQCGDFILYLDGEMAKDTRTQLTARVQRQGKTTPVIVLSFATITGTTTTKDVDAAAIDNAEEIDNIDYW